MALSPVMSPDTVSSMFPDRPIRPMPKRRLRERLSPEAAESIKYPPSTLDYVPLFYYPPYTPRNEGTSSTAASAGSSVNGNPNELALDDLRHSPGNESLGSGQRPSFSYSRLASRPHPEVVSRTSAHASRAEQHHATESQAPCSTTSSVDGYESFENTNNKKKRKIPTAGDAALSTTHSVNHDLGSLAMSNRPYSSESETTADKSLTPSNGYASSAQYPVNSQGISGSGRGRLGLPRSGRSPLRALPDGSNMWRSRSPKPYHSQWQPPEQQSRGIISDAIANAEKLPFQGQENTSLLQRHSSNRPPPASSLFTFTCESQVAGNVQWPSHTAGYNMGGHSSNYRVPSNDTDIDPESSQRNGNPVESRRKSRWRLERELRIAARHRQRLAADTYYQNPPKVEDIWICEFCEYERIFGVPPRALIRDYELKDRRHRQEEADRKRLLEKAKAKSRKGKKGGKGNAKGVQASGSPLAPAPLEDYDDPQDPQAVPTEHDHEHSTESDDGYDYGIHNGNSGTFAHDVDHFRKPPPIPLRANL